jgi:endoglucanase
MTKRRALIKVLGILIILTVIGFFGVQNFLQGKEWFNQSPIAYGQIEIKGVSIGNALDAPVPGEWGVEVRPEYFDSIKQAGFNTVRLPVRFSAHTSTQPPYTIDAGFLKIVRETVDAGIKSGLVVILDLHHFESIMKNPSGDEEKLLSIWEQVSQTFNEYPDNLYFEILNEPTGDLSADKWNILAARVISVIRKLDPERTIIVDAAEISSIQGLQRLKLPVDGNLIATFHFYEPFEFTHQGAGWVNGSKQWIGQSWDANKDEKNRITLKLDEAAEWSSTSKIPILMGEFGTIEQADRASRIRWTEFVTREAEKRQIGWVYWQLCSNFAIYSCDENLWDQELLGVLIPLKVRR